MSLVLLLITLAGVIVLLKKTVIFVPHGYAWTIERFGKYSRTAGPGLLFLAPMTEAVGRKVNMMEQLLEVPSLNVTTKDNVVVKVDGVVFFQVLDVAKAAYGVSNLDQALLALAITNMRSVIGSMDLIEALSKRDEIHSRLLASVEAAAEPWGIKVNSVLVKDIQPPRDVVDLMARQMRAERDQRMASEK
jgi:regulator of protease activity HflC (stomatin/prohibitin superfamily)